MEEERSSSKSVLLKKCECVVLLKLEIVQQRYGGTMSGTCGVWLALLIVIVDHRLFARPQCG